jgi:hypothetical protein
MNLGVVGSLNSTEYFGAAWCGGEYLWGAALWVGAIAEDGLAYVSTGFAWTEEDEFELRPSLDPIDRIYATFEGATGGDRAGFSDSGGDDDYDGQVDEDFLNGKDDDLDGLIDEDYAAISQQMFSCECWDYTSEAIQEYPEHQPLHLKVRQRSLAWSTEGSNEFIGLDYVISNDGFRTLRDVYVGYFVDSDVGRKSAAAYHTDDAGYYFALDTLYVDSHVQYSCQQPGGPPRDCSQRSLHIEMACMYDTPGGAPGGNSSDDLGNGTSGHFGAMLLGHTTDPVHGSAPAGVGVHTCHFVSGSGTYPGGTPQNDYERYDLLASGWKPQGLLQPPADYRYCLSAGPFRELLPGEELRFQVALVVGAGQHGMLSNAIAAQRIYNGQWRDLDGLGNTGCYGRETCLHVSEPGASFLWQDPCDMSFPPLPPVKIKNTDCDRSAYWVDNDCNCCTPLQINAQHCEGWESLVHWVGMMTLPPPRINIADPEMRAQAEGDQRIAIEWDNASEVALGAAGEIPFCGYRIWRVEGWRRPLGSFGPAPHEWQPVAELASEPRGVQLDLRDYTNEFAEVVDTLYSSTGTGEPLLRYAVGRYFFVDSLGLKNGMLYFYDVTAYGCWYDSLGRYHELESQPAALESEGVRPRWGAVTGSDWKTKVMVVPNPWRGSAAWDLIPSDADPTGTHIAFANLPDAECAVRIYTLAGDLVQILHHDPGMYRQGTLRWNMISRNGQEITSGVYIYAITCGKDTKVARFTVIR